MSNFWNNVYKTKPLEIVSWYSATLPVSFDLIRTLCPSHEAHIIDVGAGRSMLVDQLLDEHYENITLFDISDEAIQQTKQRLENRASKITALIGDITDYSFGSSKFDLWHDRAVFHFLTTLNDRHLYKSVLREALNPGASFIIATFGPDGPVTCSNCETVRYSDASMSDEFGDDFKMLGSMLVDHDTPFKTKQQFIYCWFRYQP